MGQIRNDVDATEDSYPYVTGMGFRNRAHLIFDEFHQDSADCITADGQVVFIKTDMVPAFFAHVMPHIKNKITILTHNSAMGVDERYLTFLSHPRVIRWFTQNANISHPKLTALPLGLGNQRWTHGNTEELCDVINENIEKKYLVYMNFDINTNSAKRAPVYDLFKGKDYVLSASRKPFREYLRDLKASKFALSPPGSGIDCHRIWESLAVGTIPIVETCQNVSFFQHMPIFIVDNWEKVTQEVLEEQYSKFSSPIYSSADIFMDSWIKKVGLSLSPRHLPAGVIAPPGCTLENTKETKNE